ncbi:uncharacterized protein LOC112269889 [Brachypodium distachyon]|uniref:NAC domain-containing protein n=1 Tax=Brachypodium distachyon TaxID=15368 RepID=I1GKV4_BRADI|nr:uncharacterized protein LOC112269889 [Brachypodium distachyon]XP_024313128.1 uncharacterized protein LOC112269889 [Brachypodium distachyon]XP_024313129.1 uncharacterized protein LOC112269889 [Brachypodium distachyon]XP_024313130.1 uncharacterized protein LOC112269889 [Brachypodium distachyon]XP_024313131.1 uncharacterized protein LOC112269889 [Brachypodium distachyon]XP_024313132.1 uncharacterized protein LOC112269889 [Brachypodium distachyon]XP_024313133.1 uncharacterized protein LOC11226|eukprot:XP_024313127.1 uncharacterized protein LOC112269889 [Brachypodium distachyon]
MAISAAAAANFLDAETTGNCEPHVAAPASGEDGNNKEPVLSELALVDILRRWKNNNGDLPAFVHKLDPYAYPPWEAVQGLKHDRRATKHVGGEKTWFIVSVDGNRRGRKVGEAGTWHVEDGGKAILGADGSSVVANKKRFSYKKSRPEKGGKQESTGWIMMQYSLEKDKERDLISMVYKSSHKYAARTSTPASSHAGAEEDIASVDAPTPAVSIRQTSKRPIPVRSLTIEEAEGHLMSEDYPVPGDKAAEDYTEMYASMLRQEITPIGGGRGAHDGRFLVDVPEGEGGDSAGFADHMLGVAFGYPNFSAVNNGAGGSTGLLHDRSMDIDQSDGYDWEWDDLLNLLPAENLDFKALEDKGLDFYDMINN